LKVIIDTNILISMMHNDIGSQDTWRNPRNNEEIDNVPLRAKALKEQIEQRGDVIVIPAPVLAEYLIGIKPENHHEHINLINSMSCFEMAPFDEISAIECARLPSYQELKRLFSSSENEQNTASKVKFDRQIISIAKAMNVEEIWSHDNNVFKKCTESGITVKSLADIPLPPEQYSLYPEPETDKTHITH
jgi:predicted nucleic acid-binding protein